MIRKTVERFAFVQTVNVNSEVVLAGCDNCNGEFFFAGVKSEQDGPRFLTGEFYQFSLIKFCPFCGARNTKPRPVAHKES